MGDLVLCDVVVVVIDVWLKVIGDLCVYFDVCGIEGFVFWFLIVMVFCWVVGIDFVW